MIGRFGHLKGAQAFAVALAMVLVISAVLIVLLRAIVGQGHGLEIVLVALVVSGLATGVLVAKPGR